MSLFMLTIGMQIILVKLNDKKNLQQAMVTDTKVFFSIKFFF